jgi:hemolysin activation/secretion protein
MSSMKLSGPAAGAAVLFALAAGVPAVAQPVQLPGSVLPGRDRLPPAPLPESDFDFRVESPRRSPVPRAVDELRFPLRDIRLSGATVLDAERLRPIWEPLLGPEVGLSDVVGIAEQIEAAYRERGYVLTRAFVPPQRVGDGVFQISVVEGYVKAASVEGGSPETQRMIEAYLAPVTRSRPLKTEVMERALLLANDLPGVAAAGVLRPAADEPGASDLVVTVTERPLVVAGSIDNRGSRFTGPLLVSADAAYNTLPGGPHQIVGGVSATPDSTERLVAQLRYVRPIGTDGLTFSFGGTGSYGEPGADLRPLQLQTTSYAVGPRLSYPLMRTRANTLILDGGLTVQNARVRSSAEPRSFAEALETSDHWRVFDVSGTYVNNGFLQGVSSATIGLAQGLDFLGASAKGIGRSRADGTPDFTKVTTTLRRTQLIDGPVTAFAQMVGQYSTNALFAGEEIAYGGNQIGRGYEPGAITGDSGVGVSGELRWDEKFEDLYIENAQFYGFYDTARVMNRGVGQISPALASAGVGVRLSLPSDISVNLEVAEVLRGIATSDNRRTGTKILFGAALRF